jgi:hypothetical protein
VRHPLFDALADLHALGHVAPCEAPDETFAWLSDDRTDRRYAATRCRASCPVQGDCLDYALAIDARYGVYGGQDFTTTAAARCGTTAGYTAHQREGTRTCAACRGAVADYHRQRRAQLKEATA